MRVLDRPTVAACAMDRAAAHGAADRVPCRDDAVPQPHSVSLVQVREHADVLLDAEDEVDRSGIRAAYASKSRLMSSAGVEWVSAPTEIKSTPVAATSQAALDSSA